MSESRSSKRAKKESAAYWTRQIRSMWPESAAIEPEFDKKTGLPTGRYKKSDN